MAKRRLICLVLSIAMCFSMLTGMIVVSAAEQTDETAEVAMDAKVIDFTTMTEVPVYSESAGEGFVSVSSAIRAEGYERQVADTSSITISSDGATVTESDGSYLYEKTNSLDGDDYNRGGLIYRVDTGSAGAYHLEVTVTGSSSDTAVAPTGMQSTRLTGTSNWDNANHVPRTVSAVWSGSTWTYDFATGEDFIEIEIEPASVPSASSPITVGVKSISITPLENNAAGDKPTIHILGDSTQKTYTFNETISSWGQTLKNYFDLDKVNVINYSMGGRAMKTNYNEGRFDEVLITGKEGDFVFIHSAHNDETVSTNRFSRGSGISSTLSENNESYNTWLDMYCKAIIARGMTPVLVTAMPRTGSGKYSESTTKPNGFNPDSPGNMRTKAATDSKIGLVELYAGAKDYIDSLDANEIAYIYNTVEAGETPAENYANGGSGDGTHYREAAAKQWCRIMLQSIYDQSVATTDTYNDQSIMKELVSYMPDSVQNAAATGDWSAVFPEMASDVSAVGVVPGATKQAKDNYYYRTSIEKVLQLGLMHKDSDNNFKPTEAMTVGEFARAMEKVFDLDENSLTNYTKTYAELVAENATVTKLDADIDEAAVASVDEEATIASGEYTVTVEQPEGATVTIYNESQHTTYTADVPAITTASQLISDNEYFTFTGPANITNKVPGSDSNNSNFDNSEISGNYVYYRNKNDAEAYYTAKASGTITLYASSRSDRGIECTNTSTSTKVTKYMDGSAEGSDAAGESSSTTYGTVQFSVEAGVTYTLAQNGSDQKLYGIMYEAEYPQSTESLTANAGDTIKVSVAANSGYVNGSILVNETEISTSKTCTFTVTGNMTVSATVTKEPDIVDETIIATDAALTREAMGAIMYDAYQLFAEKGGKAYEYCQVYMGQNGSVPSPDDPNYDPNLTYEGSPYIPLTGWGALTDTDELETSLYSKVKAVYNLGLMRSEQGIARGSLACGDELEPKVVVTRAKAAKALGFIYILTQPTSEESQMIPNDENMAAATVADIAVANADAPSIPYTGTTVVTDYDYVINNAVVSDGKLSVDVTYAGSETGPSAKLLVAAYDANDDEIMLGSEIYDVAGTDTLSLDYTMPSDSTVKLYIWSGTDTLTPLSEVYTVDPAAVETLQPTSAPTSAPTTAPTATPTSAPTATPATNPTSTPVAAATTLTVDQSAVADGTATFNTISDAVAYATSSINPQSESERVLINVNPGDYEEQVIMKNAKYITLQQTPGTSGQVDWHWYYCTGYCAGDCGLDGNYDPKINWSLDETWTGYNDGDEEFTKYELGQVLTDVSTISYYDTDGVAHKDVKVQKDHLGDFNDQAALVIQSSCSDITVKDFNIVNSIPVMVTEGEKRVGVAPQEDRNADNATSYVLPHRDNLVICDEDTEMETSSAINSALAISDDASKVKALEALTDLTAEQSAYLVRSNKYNERGHAISINGDKIILENIRARGNQDSVYISTGRIYFKNCNLIGGTDYIYGNATAVFDNCLLGAEGMSNQSYGATITAANTDASNPYGYLFWNCTLYNMLDNIGTSAFGRPWRQDAQITFYNTKLDDTASIGASAAGINSIGWSDMSGNTKEAARFYEYGTYNASGSAVDLSGRVVRDDGFGSVLDEWQILEFNPRNYFNSSYHISKGEWDPMNFGETYLSEVDAQIAAATITVPEGEDTTITLPTSTDSNIEFMWESASTNAVVSSDGTSIKVIRPAAGEDPIETTVTLYAMDKTTGYGDKVEIPVTIAATTDTTNVFSIPVTITQSAIQDSDNDYTITVSKNGALIKEQVVAVAAGETTASATIENVPASASGIEYNVKVVSASDEFTIVTPEEGTADITGVTGKNVTLDIIANKIVDKKVTTGVSVASSEGTKSYDLVALAVANGAGDEIYTSDVLSVDFDVTVNSKPATNGYIDLVSTTPSSSCSQSALSTRYALTKINYNWIQLDMVDCSQGFSGSSNTGGQCLNLCAKFTSYPITQHVKVTIDYKNETVSVTASNISAGTYTFESFPADGSRGSLYLGFYPSTSDDYELSDVKVTYKSLVTGEEEEEVVPEGSGIYTYAGTTSNFSAGNACTNSDGTFSFVDGADATIASFFADASDSTVLDSTLYSNYINYIGGTSGSHPKLSTKGIPAGKYKVYYLGYNSDANITATYNGVTSTSELGVNFAKGTSKTYKLYTFDLSIPESNTGDQLVFDSPSSYLPDLYSVVIVGTNELN